MERVGVGVVGLGMGVNHAHAFADYEKARLVALCDIRSDLLKRVSKEFNVKAYTSYHDMLQDPKIDAVAIATPSFEHAPMGIYAALHGKHRGIILLKTGCSRYTFIPRPILLCL